MALPERLLSVTKKVIRNAAQIGIDEAGSRLLGSGWLYLKRVLAPVMAELEKRYPKLFLVDQVGSTEAKEAAEKAIEYLSSESKLQEMLVTEFMALEEGQDEILQELKRLEIIENILVRQDRKLDHLTDLGEEILGVVTDELQKSECEDTSLTPVDNLAMLDKTGQLLGVDPAILAIFKNAYRLGHFITQVLEIGETGQSYELVIGETKYHMKPGPKFKDELGRTFRDYSEETYQNGQWSSSVGIQYREIGGSWKSVQ